MENKLKAFNNGMRYVQAQNDDCKKNVVQRNNLVNLETTFSLLPTTIKASSSTQNICLTISPHPTSTYAIPPQMPSVYTINPNNFQVTMMPNIHPSAIVFPSNENKHDQLATHLYSRRERDIQSTCYEDLGKELFNLREAFDEELRSRNCQSLKYENLCVHPNVDLPTGYSVPKFNTFNGKGNPVSHLKDYCSRLIGIGHVEAIRMRLFIQSLSGLALSWFTKQDFSKWHTWEDMAHDFVKQYEFNNGDDLHIADLLKVKKLSHESFQEYAIRWRLEASKIHPSLSEEELISTFIHVQEGLYYEKLLGTCAHNFSDLIKVGKEIENGIQGGRIVSNSPTKVVQQTFQAKIPINLQSKMRENNSIFTTMQQPQHYPSDQLLQSHATSNYCNMRLQHPCKQQLHQAQSSSRPLKKVKPFSFTPLDEPYADIFERLRANRLLQSKKGFIRKNMPKHFDPSKNCAYHSNIQGHDTEGCPALKFKIQSMIDSGKIKLQSEPSGNNGNIADTSTFVVKGDPSKLSPKRLKRKRAISQED
ncbi:hypothetical protein KY285_001157 [Solanum tuberosum]|nr:hypothetical protein KY285_006813 [Solanum tuberosum]KAH0765286.1 hypothetical protein KY285_001157 [Solanum tuberosum]